MVGDCAFYGTTIKEIEIPESIKYVDSDAFYKSEQLEKIIIPKGLDIDLKTKAIIERNNKNYEPLQKFYDNCEKNDIKLLKEEIDGLEQGYFLSTSALQSSNRKQISKISLYLVLEDIKRNKE